MALRGNGFPLLASWPVTPPPVKSFLRLVPSTKTLTVFAVSLGATTLALIGVDAAGLGLPAELVVLALAWSTTALVRFRLVGATNPTYFALYARRRMELYGESEADWAQVKVKNARHGLANPNARYRKEVSAEEVLASAMVSDPLRLLQICTTSDGGAALVLSSLAFARGHGAADPVTVAAVSTVTPTFPQTVIEMPYLATDSSATTAPPERLFRDAIAHAAYEEAGAGPEDLSLAEVYDLSTALELDWYENIGLCKEGEASRLVHDGDTALGGRIPVNPSGGLACFGEAVPAQAIAQVCEITWQLRGTAEGRQVEGARVGLTINQGLFGHGSSVICVK